MTDAALLTIDDGVATVTLNRDDSRNALSVELLAALHERFDELEVAVKSGEVRAAVVTGAGRAFCAGMNLKEVVIDLSLGGCGDVELPGRLLGSLARLTLRVRALPVVVVAKVGGAAIGGGAGLACVADVCVSHADAKIGFPEVGLGLCPGVIAPWVIKKMGPGPARRAMLMGGVMSGADAAAVGIVDVLADDRASLDSALGGVVRTLTSGGVGGLAATKALANELDGSDDEAAVMRGAAVSANVLMSGEAQQRLAARLS